MNISKALKELESTIASNVIAICNKVKEIEDLGEYERATQTMGEWWQGIGVRPNVNNLPNGEKAMILLRIGVLSGWIGSMQQKRNSQEMAKDLISESVSLFKLTRDRSNWAEASSDLAICYWREGAYDEARIILQDILGSGFKFSPELQGKLLLRSVNVEISTRYYDYALSFINQATPLIENEGSDVLRGKLYFHRALIMRHKAEEENRPDFLNSAVEDYRLAAEFYQQAGHLQFLASVEINLGFLLLTLDKYTEAHLHFDAALEILNHKNDMGLAAAVYDNKARTFIAQGNISDAELAACKSVSMLRKGGENVTLAESLTTLGAVLSRGGNVNKAIRTFVEAKETALRVGDKESAGNAILTHLEELQSDLTPIVFRALYLEADELLWDSHKKATVDRLRRVARKQFEINDNLTPQFKREKYFKWKNFSLPDAVHAYERELILKALSDAGGRLTKAAGLLGVSHQSLSLTLHQRHKDLQQHRIQRKPRGSLKAENH